MLSRIISDDSNQSISVNLVGSLLAHADEAVVRGDHQKTVIRTAAEQAKHSGAKISLMSCQVGEANHLGLGRE